MGLTINTNVASLNAQRNLGQSQNALSKSMTRLSSGLRINSAKDDAAGLAISDRMTSQIRGLNQAVRNANDGISLSQTAEGALQESTNILQRMRELAVQSANDTNTASDRSSMQAEVNQLQQELSRIAETTTFNGKNVLDGTLVNAKFQIGANKGETIGISIQDMSTTNLGVNQVKTANANGIEAATHQVYLGGASYAGNEIGVVRDNSATNGYDRETFTTTYTDQAGSTQTDTYKLSAANLSAKAIASELNTNLSGVTATAFNKITISSLSGSGTDFAIKAGTTANQTVYTDGTDTTLADMAENINSNANLQAAGVYAVSNGTSIDIFAVNGDDIQVVSENAGTGTVAITGLAGDQVTSTIGETITTGGRVDVQLQEGVNLTASGTSILSSTSSNFVGGSQQMGSEIGKVQVGGTGNAYSSEVFSVAYTDSNGNAKTDSLTTTAADSAKTIASNITSSLDNVTATAYSYVDVKLTSTNDDNTDLLIKINDTTVFALADTTQAQFATTALAATITGITVENHGDFVRFIDADGDNIKITATDDGTSTNGLADTIDVKGMNDSDWQVAGTDSATVNSYVGGRIDLTLEEGTTLTTAGTTLLSSTTPLGSAVAQAAGTGGNNVGAQTLTIVGPNGSADAEVNENDSAFTIAQSVNAQSGATGVSASAETKATLSNLSADGTVSFQLRGDNTVDAATISATVTQGDLGALVDAINSQAGQTGVTAVLSDGSDAIELTLTSGRDIRIDGFQHSAAIDYQNVVSSPVSGSGTSVLPANEVTIQVAGQEGKAVTLKDGGVTNGAQDSTVVGGEVTFNSSGSFNVTSNISGGASSGAISGGTSLFGGVANSANASALESVNEIDISTQTGAADAIAVLDGALAQVDEVRGQLGAVQNRFESTISNLQNISENLSAARSRILDADIAQETSEMTKQNILQQAGVSILAQANQAPQLALSLLG